ncbi:MAG: hypothetical protein A2X48_19635 [Lentisphaerae bacterium GWF2_49_21]|nr:MAG: hypothetical protein A2X48_19635 [Lentisphaerae bacterium GWF2_49_21]
MEKPPDRYSRYFQRLSGERAAIYLEYSMLFAFVAIMVCAPLIPGGPAYQFMRSELMLRVFLISMPFF